MTSRAAWLAAAVGLTLTACPAPRRVVRPAAPPTAGGAGARPPAAGSPWPAGVIGAAPPGTGATAARPARPLPVPLAASEYHEEPEVVGVTHLVRRGETVYRIARAYGLDAADLLEVNGIVDPRQVSVGTELFVPGASRVVDVEETTGKVAGSNSTPTSTSTPTPTSTSTSTQASRLAWPLKGVLYGRYGVRAGRRHDGIDLAAPEGTPIGAAAAGTVIYAGEQAGYGSIVILRHPGGLVTLYAHCSEVLVEEGREVRRGEPVARVGQTGRTSGPHLHFEVRDGTRPRNPLLFLP
ncbi:MAG: peptidoglycan DD-metalloendopeptidase family protein [Anaeromyxobacter sp.]|nr:peptidoglycan DD-metalloendopeptidase family protein [Anaeromyxobacter sp.]